MERQVRNVIERGTGRECWLWRGCRRRRRELLLPLVAPSSVGRLKMLLLLLLRWLVILLRGLRDWGSLTVATATHVWLVMKN